MMKISNTILAVFQLKNHMSAKAAHKCMANLDYSFLRLCVKRSVVVFTVFLVKLILPNFLCQCVGEIGHMIPLVSHGKGTYLLD